MIVKIIFCATGLLGGLASPAWAGKGCFYDQTAILSEFFPRGSEITSQPVDVDAELGARLKAKLGYVPRSPYQVWVGRKDGAILGYAVIDDEKGMHEPITFAVLIDPAGAVVRQEVMVYRETEGDGVTRSRFRRQFIGKTVKDPLRAGVDITIVSGATISSHSMAVGVKRALTIVQERFVSVPATQAASAAVEQPPRL